MPAKLYKEPRQSERHKQKKTIKNIDDLILDAEIEAQAEINQRIRTKKTRRLLVLLVGVGLLYVLNSAIQNQSIPVPSFLMEETEVAEAPTVLRPTPKPIPFPITESAPAVQTPVSALNEPQGEDLSPLENEAISMIQKNLGEPESAARGTGTEPIEPAQQAFPVTDTTSPLSSENKPSTASAVPANPAPKPALQTREAITAETSRQKPAPPRLTQGQSEFFIQVGAFSVKANADRVIKKLVSGGFSPLVQTRTTLSSMYVVFIGGFADKKSPQNMISELRNKGLNPILKKNDNGSYSIILGKDRSKEKAELLKQNLAKQGIFTSMKQMKIDMRMFIVRVGGYETNTNALQGQKKLANMGYKKTLIRKKS